MVDRELSPHKKTRFRIKSVLDALRRPGTHEDREHDFSEPFHIEADGIVYVADVNSSQTLQEPSAVDEIDLLDTPVGTIRVIETLNPATDRHSRLVRVIRNDTTADGNYQRNCYTVELNPANDLPIFHSKMPASSRFGRIDDLGEQVSVALPAGTTVVDFKAVEQVNGSRSDSATNPTAARYERILNYTFSVARG